jgi:hypothetical protein
MTDWRTRWRSAAVLLPMALFLLNLFLVRRLLGIEYLDEMGSIESSHIAIARWARLHWGELSWFPLWYGGIPYLNTYPPLLHRLVAAVSALAGLSVPHAYHALTAIFYSLGPVALYALAVRLGGSRLFSFAGGLFYSLVSTSAWLIPAVRRDAGDAWGLRRLQDMVQYGEGPHIAAMTLLPLALCLLATAFEKKRPAWWFAAVLGLASVPLTNWLGAAALAMAVPALLLAREDGFRPATWLKAAAVGVLAYGIASPLIPPSYIATVAHNERFTSGAVAAGSIRLAFVCSGLAIAAVSIWLCRKFRLPQGLLFAWLFLLPVAMITLAAEWYGVPLAHQAGRYHVEMEMALALFAVFLAQWLLHGTTRRLLVTLACLAVLAAGYGVVRCAKVAARRIRPIEIASTIEYREAKWFERNLPGRRVFAPGSVGFFLNVFTDVPQFAGGVDQAVVNPLWTDVQYQVLTGDNAGDKEGEVATLWLKAFGVSAVGVSGPGSKETFKPFRNPKKFDGLLPELWREGDDVIYRIPRRSNSLAHVVRPSDLPPRHPEGGLDMDPVRHYVAALDDPALPAASMTWQSHDRALIQAQMQTGQVVSVQATYHPGWHASVNGAPRPVKPDNLGQVVIEPDCQGQCTIEYLFSPGLDLQICRLLSGICLGFGLIWVARDILRRRRLPA